MLMFSEDIVDLSIKVLADWLVILRLCQHVLTEHYSDINITIRRTQGYDNLMLMLTVSYLKLLGVTFQDSPTN